MHIKKLILTGIVASVLFFFLGWLVYGHLIANFMQHHTGRLGRVDRKEVKLTFIIIGNIFQGFTLAYIFSIASINQLTKGLLVGGILGLLTSAAVDCLTFGTTLVMSKQGIVADVLAATVLSAVIGAVLGMILQKAKG